MITFDKNNVLARMFLGLLGVSESDINKGEIRDLHCGVLTGSFCLENAVAQSLDCGSGPGGIMSGKYDDCSYLSVKESLYGLWTMIIGGKRITALAKNRECPAAGDVAGSMIWSNITGHDNDNIFLRSNIIDPETKCYFDTETFSVEDQRGIHYIGPLAPELIERAGRSVVNIQIVHGDLTYKAAIERAYVELIGEGVIQGDMLEMFEKGLCSATCNDMLVDKVSEYARECKITGGSGVVISDQGDILTAAHVLYENGKLENSYEIIIADHSYKFGPGNVIFVDHENDVARIRIPELAGHAFIPVSEQETKPGDVVWGIGFPTQHKSDAEHTGQKDDLKTFSVGRVLSTHRDEKRGLKVRTSAILTYGYSGGALVNERGELVGVLNKREFKDKDIFKAIFFITDESSAFLPNDQR